MSILFVILFPIPFHILFTIKISHPISFFIPFPIYIFFIFISFPRHSNTQPFINLFHLQSYAISHLIPILIYLFLFTSYAYPNFPPMHFPFICRCIPRTISVPSLSVSSLLFYSIFLQENKYLGNNDSIARALFACKIFPSPISSRKCRLQD